MTPIGLCLFICSGFLYISLDFNANFGIKLFQKKCTFTVVMPLCMFSFQVIVVVAHLREVGI